jgi:hypothetical protein
MQLGGKQGAAIIFKSNQATVEQKVHVRRQHEAIESI